MYSCDSRRCLINFFFPPVNNKFLSQRHWDMGKPSWALLFCKKKIFLRAFFFLECFELCFMERTGSLQGLIIKISAVFCWSNESFVNGAGYFLPVWRRNSTFYIVFFWTAFSRGSVHRLSSLKAYFAFVCSALSTGPNPEEMLCCVCWMHEWIHD